MADITTFRWCRIFELSKW